MPSCNNRLLASLSTDDFDLLGPHLSRETQQANRCRLFPRRGFASVVAVQSTGKQVEVGLVGREGMTGFPMVLGNHRSPHATYIQASGKGQCMPATELHKATQTSFANRLLKFEQASGVQTTHTAICNAQPRWTCDWRDEQVRVKRGAFDLPCHDPIPLSHASN